jgi:hypothetical protein
MTIRSRILGTAAAGVVILGVGLPGLPVGATPDDEGIEQPCFVDCGPVLPPDDDPGPAGPGGGPGGFQQCVENENTPGDDCYDHPQDDPDDPEDPPDDPEVTVTEDAPRRADPNFTG